MNSKAILTFQIFLTLLASWLTPASAVAAKAAKVPKGAKVTDDGWFAPKKKPHHPTLPKNISRAFVIPISEPIKTKTFKAIRRKAVRCRARGAELIILDMDTWGGEVGAALDITRLLKRDLDDIYVVCYVNTRGISAGAMIALACDEIVMNPVGKLGDCAPILMQGKLEGVEREKIESPLRTEFEESAERNGYNVALATSMVSYDQEVWLVRNLKTRQLRYVLASNYRNKVVDAPPEDSDTEKKGGKKTRRRTKRKARPTKRPEWELLEVTLAEGKLLTMTPKKALEFAFASNIIKAPRDDPYAGLVKHFNISTPPTVLEDTWSEDLVDFLTHPVVAGILVFLMLLFGYTEMHTPGFGVFGGIAIFCLVVLLAGQFLVGMAQWWEIAIFVLGILLIVLEIFVIPGFGVAGISGIVLCIVGGLAMLINNPPEKLPIPATSLDWNLFISGLMGLCLGFVGFLIAAAFLSKYLPRWSPLSRSRLILAPVEAAHQAPRPANSPMLRISPGQTGKAESMLRPVGRVRFGEDLLDAVSESGIIEVGRAVRVLRHDGNRIIVEIIEEVS